MKSVKDWGEADLLLVVNAGEKENISLDYKQSAALNFRDSAPRTDGRGTLGDKHRTEIIRDVAAMANAEGGKIIYGIKEKRGGYPKDIDDGYDPTLQVDTIEQILHSNIHPRVEGLVIHPIELKSKGRGRRALVIEIPKASTKGPHQTPDWVYHKRRGSTTAPMEDNEVRDMMGRSIEFGKKFGIAFDLLIEIRQIFAASKVRREIGHGDYLPRTSLKISASNVLRTSGVAVMSLPKDLRQSTARLVNAIDEYNSVIEIADPGRREEARLTDPLRALLDEIIDLGDRIGHGLMQVLSDEP